MYINSNMTAYPPSFNTVQTDVIPPIQPIDPLKPAQPTDTQKDQNSDFQQDDESTRKDRIVKKVEYLNQIAKKEALDVKLDYNQEADRVVIKYIDKSNNEIVQQIPPKAILNMDIQLKKYIGLLFDHRI